MNSINLIGWLGNLFFIFGAILLAKKNRLGFLSNVLANLIYVYFAILISKNSLLFLSLFLTVVNLWGVFVFVVEIIGKQTSDIGGLIGNRTLVNRLRGDCSTVELQTLITRKAKRKDLGVVYPASGGSRTLNFSSEG